jgi:hypothetical protein
MSPGDHFRPPQSVRQGRDGHHCRSWPPSFCRLIFGKNRVTRALLSISTIWFALNVFLAPYSNGMRQDLVNLRRAVFR